MQLVVTRAGFEALEDDWNALFARAARPEQMFQSFNWLWQWAQHFLDAESRCRAIVTIRRSGALMGVIPLVGERVLGLKQLAIMGAPVSQYGDGLEYEAVVDGGVLARGLRFAITATKADVVRLAKVRDGSRIAGARAQFDATATVIEARPISI